MEHVSSACNKMSLSPIDPASLIFRKLEGSKLQIFWCRRAGYHIGNFSSVRNRQRVCMCVCMYVMFYWPCILVYQYSETNVTHFLFSLLRIKGFYMFRALLALPQEALHKRHLVYCVRVTLVGCTIRTQYTKCRLCITSWGWASNAQNM
jgi:hypothetical protein